MSAAFQSLGEFGTWLQANPGVRVVDAGVPLSNYADVSGYGPVWESQPSVRKVVDFIARNIAAIPIHLYERVSDTDRRRVTDTPLARLADIPSPPLPAYRFWHTILCDALLYDRWCAMKVGGNAPDSPLTLHRVPPRNTVFKVDGFDRVGRIVVYDGRGRASEYDPEAFVFDSGYSQTNAAGTSPTETLAHILDEARESVQFRRDAWKRGARFTGWFTKEGQWSSDNARDRFAAQMSAYASGGGKEGGAPLLEDGVTYQDREAFKLKDTEDLEGRRLTDIEVASAYHIPPELVGAREGTYSNIDAFRQMLYRTALGPYIAARDQVLNAALTYGTDYYFETNIEGALRGSFSEQAKILQTSTGGPYMLRSEARARMNLPYVEGTEELIVPMNVTEGGQASPTDSGTQNEE